MNNYRSLLYELKSVMPTTKKKKGRKKGTKVGPYKRRKAKSPGRPKIKKETREELIEMASLKHSKKEDKTAILNKGWKKSRVSKSQYKDKEQIEKIKERKTLKEARMKAVLHCGKYRSCLDSGKMNCHKCDEKFERDAYQKELPGDYHSTMGMRTYDRVNI